MCGEQIISPRSTKCCPIFGGSICADFFKNLSTFRFKQKLSTGLFSRLKQKLSAGQFSRFKQNLSTGQFSRFEQKLSTGQFSRFKQKLSTGQFSRFKQKLSAGQFSCFKQKLSTGQFLSACARRINSFGANLFSNSRHTDLPILVQIF